MLFVFEIRRNDQAPYGHIQRAIVIAKTHSSARSILHTYDADVANWGNQTIEAFHEPDPWNDTQFAELHKLGSAAITEEARVVMVEIQNV